MADKKMYLYAPKYYREFKCIADKCKHSCCIGWEIDVDSPAIAKYEKLDSPYKNDILSSIEYGDTPHFRMCDNGRCPHLDSRGLCKIICEVGDGYLADICREHPRFYNQTSRGAEVGIGMACEEACRIILKSDNYNDYVEIEEYDSNSEAEFNVIPYRERIYNQLSNQSIPYSERLKRIYEKYGVCPSNISDECWRETISSLEYLDEAHKILFSSYSSDIKNDSKLDLYLERVLAYFIYRHTGSAESETEFRAALGFSLFCERLIASISNEDNIRDICRIVSEEIEYSESNTDLIKFEFEI